MSTKVYSHLSKDGLATLDVDDFMGIINQLMLEKENLINECNSKVAEIGTWREVLQAETTGDVNELVNVLPNQSTLSAEETKALLDYTDLSKIDNAFGNTDICKVCLTEEGEMLLQFTSPFSNVQHSIWLTSEDGQYSLKYHDLPKKIPVNQLLLKYSNAEDDEGLKKFCTVISQYVWPIFFRKHQADKFEESVNDSQTKYVYRNEDLTVMSFVVPINHEDKRAMYEFTLHYDVKKILPDDVKTTIISKDPPHPVLQEAIEELANEMSQKPFSDVICYHLGSDAMSTSGQSSNSTNDTINFELFSSPK